MRVHCPHCHSAIELSSDCVLSHIDCPSCGSWFNLVGESETLPFSETEPTVLGHFELIEQIGVGSFGSVWRARDVDLDRVVAIKIPRKRQLTADETERFLREARAAAQLQHSNIVAVHEVGREGDTIYIASDFVDGVTLGEWLTARDLSAKESAHLIHDLAEATHHAHQAGVIHRDLKPGNVMIDRHGVPHIMDFGLARREAGDVTMTLDGRVLGTPAYMSPEQARGDSAEADSRTDIYSLGVILFELLTGHRPFRGSARMLLHQIIQDEAPDPRSLNTSIPRDLATITLKCLEKSPDARYPSAQALADDLRRFLDGEPVQARSISVLERRWRWCKRHPLISGLLAGIALALTLGLIGTSSQWYRAVLALNREETARRDVQRQLRLTNLERVAAQSLAIREESPIRSLLLAIEATEESRRVLGQVSPSAYHSLIAALGTVGGEQISLRNTPIQCLVSSPDSQWVATGGADGSITVITLRDKREARLMGHTAVVNCLEISPDSSWLASASADKTARIWHAKGLGQFEERFVLGKHQDAIRFLKISPSGRWVITAGRTELYLWDMTSDHVAEDPTVVDHIGARIYRLDVSPDERWMGTANEDGDVRLWRMTDLKAPPIVLKGHSRVVDDLAFSRDGKWLATGSWDASIRLWDLKSVEHSPTSRKLVGHSRAVGRVWFTPDSSYLVSSGDDNAVRFWPMDNIGEAKWTRQGLYPLVVSDDGRWITAAAGDGTVRIWELDERSLGASEIILRGHDRGVEALDITADGKWLLTGGLDGSVRQWDLTSRDPSSTYPAFLSGHQTNMSDLTISSDGQLLVRCDWDHTVNIWDISDLSDLKLTRLQVEEEVECAQLTHTNSCLFTSSASGIRRWDLSLPQPTLPPTIAVPTSPVRRLLISDDDSWLVGLLESSTAVYLWRISGSYEIIGEIVVDAEVGTLTDACFIPGHDSLLLASAEGVIVRLDLVPNREPLVRRIFESQAAISAISCSPDGSSFAIGNADGRVRLLRLHPDSTSVEQHLLQDRGEAVSDIEFAPDGRSLVASRATSRTAHVWNLKSPEHPPLVITCGASRGPASIRFMFSQIVITPDSRWLISGDQPHFWDLDVDAVISLARKKAGRELDDSERQEFQLATGNPTELID